jgi:hypothetical protein
MTHEAPQAGYESPSPEDVAAIDAIAHDYVEGWFDGDEARMRRCLHPELVKRTIYHDPATDEWSLGRPADAAMMIDWTREGEGRTDVPSEREFEVIIEHVFRHIASVRVFSTPYMDYLQIAKIGDRWWIVNALWEVREGWTTP